MPEAIIVGGGVAGPVAGMALIEAGWSATVFEAYPADVDAVGSWLALQANGIDALAAIDAQRLVTAAGFPTRTMRFVNGRGRELGTMTNGNPLPDGTASHLVRRSALYRALRDEADRRGVRMRPPRRCSRGGGWSGDRDLPTVPTWHRGPLALIGDAAHATAPSAGQGAPLSLEDAVIIARCLRDAPGPDAAFSTFERLRRDRVEKIVANGNRGSTSKAAGPVGRVLRDAMLPLVFRHLGKNDSAATRWITDHHVDWTVDSFATAPESPRTGPAQPSIRQGR